MEVREGARGLDAAARRGSSGQEGRGSRAPLRRADSADAASTAATRRASGVESGAWRRPGGGLRAPLARALDITAALVLLVLTAPLLLAGVTLVAVAAGRPLLFGHRRVGRGGRPFRCWKLRTMRADAEAVLERDPELFRRYRENGFKLPASGDPRIIPGGRWLRRTYLDELPQLFNVLAGDMSLVGPRPVVEDELRLFGDDARVLLSVRPGLFGAWTSRGRHRPPYPERARIEVASVRQRSLAGDARILLRSVGAVLRGQERG